MAETTSRFPSCLRDYRQRSTVRKFLESQIQEPVVAFGYLALLYELREALKSSL